MFGFGKSHWRSSAAMLADDLSTLRVNTILKPQITGGSMPAVRFALCDIAERYEIELFRIDSAIGPGLEEAAESPEAIEPTRGGYPTFDSLQEESKQLQQFLREHGALDDERVSDFYMLSRIRENSNRIKRILKPETEAGESTQPAENTTEARDPAQLDRENDLTRGQIAERLDRRDGGLADLQLDPRDLLAVQKIWELGVETIAMQTSVQLDGDIVTRVNSEFAVDDYMSLHDIHRMGLEVGLNCWGGLVRTLTQMAKTIVAARGAKES